MAFTPFDATRRRMIVPCAMRRDIEPDALKGFDPHLTIRCVDDQNQLLSGDVRCGECSHHPWQRPGAGNRKKNGDISVDPRYRALDRAVRAGMTTSNQFQVLGMDPTLDGTIQQGMMAARIHLPNDDLHPMMARIDLPSRGVGGRGFPQPYGIPRA